LLWLTIAATALSSAGSMAAQPAKTRFIHSFNGTDGRLPSAGLVMDAKGILYGTTRTGGANDKGTVFRLTQDGARWKHAVLHSFDGTDGQEPFGDLTLGAEGTLYGTTSAGGQGNGTVFALAPPVAGHKWKLKTLHAFSGAVDDGGIPFAGVILGPDGSLFGTTIGGGQAAQGTAFMLSPPAQPDGDWKFRLLTSFVGGKDGSNPNARLTLDENGVLFGTTTNGGRECGCGTVFMLTPPAAAGARAKWTKTILYRFAGKPDGHNPYSALVGDGNGAYYGTTFLGGSLDYGTVFKIEPPTPPSDKWKVTILADFNGTDGRGPLFYGPLARDENGVLYGVTQESQNIETIGTVFQLTPPATGQRWKYKTLHAFKTDGNEGNTPDATVVRDALGTLFGTTVLGGPDGAGTVYTVRP
jgi:uncharacterized repeat protein (TIGR03803 family)